MAIPRIKLTTIKLMSTQKQEYHKKYHYIINTSWFHEISFREGILHVIRICREFQIMFVNIQSYILIDF